MKEELFTQQMERWRDATAPQSPDLIEANVLRRVREEREKRTAEPAPSGMLISLLDSLRPATAAAALIMAVLVGSASAAFYHTVSRPAEKPAASVALGFEPFARPVSLPTDHP
jgi:hypothetical protein